MGRGGPLLLIRAGKQPVPTGFPDGPHTDAPKKIILELGPNTLSTGKKNFSLQYFHIDILRFGKQRNIVETF